LPSRAPQRPRLCDQQDAKALQSSPGLKPFQKRANTTAAGNPAVFCMFDDQFSVPESNCATVS